MEPAVSVKNLSIAFASASGSLTVLSDFDLTVAKNEFVSLIGPSGCGKTTVLRCIASLIQPTAGEVEVNGMRPQDAVKSRQIGYVFQSATLLEWRNVLKNVLLPLELAGVSHKTAVPRAQAMIERVGLSGFMKHYPRQLSGGMQQRVAIARAMIMEPDIILMDEPFASLDEMTRDDMNQWLTEVFMSTDSTVLFVTHNIREAIQLSDRVVVMAGRPGRIIKEYEVPFSRPRTAEFLFSPEFSELRQGAEQTLYGAAHAMREVSP